MQKVILVISFVVFVLISFSGQAQKKNKGTAQDGTEYSDKFHELFFLGLKEMGMDNLQKAEDAFKECLKINDREPAIYYELSKLYWKEGNASDALIHAKTAFELDPANEDIFRHYTAYLESTRQYEAAAKATLSFLKQLPSGSKKVVYSKMLATYYTQSRQTVKAIEVYQDLEAEFGFSNAYALERFSLYHSNGNYEKAHEELDQLILRNPTSPQYLYLKGHLYYKLDDPDNALSYYDKVLRLDARHSGALSESAVILYDRDRDESYRRYSMFFGTADIDAATQLREFSTLLKVESSDEKLLEFAQLILKAHESNASANRNVFDLLKKMGRLGEAIPYIETASKNDPSDFALCQELLSTYYLNRAFEKLKSSSNDALELFPNQPSLYLYSGIASIELGAYDDALIMLETGKAYLIGNTPLRQDFDLSLAELYHHMGEYDKSDKIFEELLSGDRNNATVLNNYAYFLSLRGDRLNDAETMSKKAMELEPENATYIDTYGWVLFMGKKYKESIEWLTKAVSINSSDPDILEHLGDAYSKANNIEKALEYWQKAKLQGGSGILDKKIADKKYYES